MRSGTPPTEDDSSDEPTEWDDIARQPDPPGSVVASFRPDGAEDDPNDESERDGRDQARQAEDDGPGQAHDATSRLGMMKPRP